MMLFLKKHSQITKKRNIQGSLDFALFRRFILKRRRVADSQGVT